MSSILGHGLAGMTVASALARTSAINRPKLFAIAAGLGIAPDLDVIVYMLFGVVGISAHRGLSHTLIFVLVGGAATSVLLRKHFDLSFQRGLALFSTVLLSHVILDYLMGAGPGVPFFWPLSKESYLFPYKVVPTAFYSLNFGGLMSLLIHIPTLMGLFFEAMIFLPLFLMLSGKATLPRWFLSGISVVGVACTVYVYNVLLQVS
jgi:membrane-bound metal-dependent hydrolase YbcI (DUF457 family)